ncbi:hypothetical protein Pth03_16880 [Planotetraspora thailandica]|uniref:Secreted protein n=1 Tax=Planotetraspora thailandica TaxID=487172 RepID=A0A8J3XUI1_9ACTN|nr:DUF5719 family protein [Planotetraspora thailandica]GII53299.1 hypothetical protein Pth03_16880 [Planotetraspora thailandica]
MKSLIENRFGLLALVLVALGALYGVAYGTRPAAQADTPPRPVRAPMESVTAVCPAAGGSTLSVVTPPAGQTRDQGEGGGGAVVAPLQQPADAAQDATKPNTGKQAKAKKAAGEPVSLQRTGVLWQQAMTAGTGAVSVAASGPMAAGLEGSQTARLESGSQRGLASTRCVEPGADAWFVGPGPAAATMTLYVANADEAPADIQIMIYSGEGLVLNDRGSGLVLKPGENRTVNLRDLAPSPLVMAVQVSTSGGRVAAAVKAVLGKGKGVDWLPVAAPPAKQVVVPGIPGTAGLRELYVTAPGGQDTVVQVKAVLKDGSYALKNKETVEVPAGSTTTFDLSTGIGGQPAALLLTSDIPIVAGLKITGTGMSQDVAFTAGAPSIDLGTVVADNRVERGVSSRLVLSAPFSGATVKVQLLPKQGTPPDPVEVKVPAARTKEINLKAPPGGDGRFAVFVQPEPGSGPVYGGRAIVEDLRSGQMITTQPFAPATIWALVPPTADSPSVVLP